MHDRHVRLPLVATMLMLNIGPDQLDIFVWCVQELMATRKCTSNENSDSANLAKFIRTFQHMANAMQAQATAVEHMMDQLNRRFEESVGGNGADAKYQKFSEFRKMNPPSFKGAFNPDEADEWIKEIKKIYSVLACLETQKVAFATYMLKLDVEFWWKGAKSLMESD